ncbi:MAG: methyltransferase domain-containing protein [Actinomycetota bacterium]|nr:methyltransferase domain-containing protein [Actinomycetota bacterium]
MPLLARALITAGRLRRRAQRRGPDRPREEVVREYAAGRSFVDVGCMWSVHGAIAFAAEEAGATRVTGIDMMEPTPEYVSEHARRRSKVRFVSGDLHDPATIASAGVHEVVWCSGVLYHVPHPLLTLQRLRELTSDLIIVSTETMPEVPGLPGACVFYPALDERGRRDHVASRAGVRIGLSTPFRHDQLYEHWWWGMTPSALRGMLTAAGLELLELTGGPFHRMAVARPLSR